MADEVVTGGNEGGSSSTATPSSGGQTSVPAEPSVIELNDDALIKPKGFEKPVKYGEHVRGLQGQFTKASQEAARLKKELADRDARLKQLEQARQQANQGQNGPQQPDVFAQLEALPYLDGKQAAEVVRNIQGAINQRDQVLLATLKQIQQLKGIVDQLHGSHTNQNFEGKIAKWLQDGGYDPGFANLAKEIYLAYEGDDLDNEFPQIFATRVAEIEKLYEAKRQAKIQSARKQPFIPGKGAVVGPSKPLEIKPNATAKELADILWNEGMGSET